MDQKQKNISDPRFNIFDVLIVLALVICLVAIGIRLIFIGKSGKDVVQTEVSFEVAGVSEVTAEALCRPDRHIYLQSDNSRAGSVSSAEYTAQSVWTEDCSGNSVEALHPDKKTVRGIARIKGIWTDDGFWINGSQLIAVGQTLDIYTEDAFCTITITAIAEKQ